MPKQSIAANAAPLHYSDALSPSTRLDVLGKYARLRDWSLAVIDLMEVAGRSMCSDDRIEIADQTLMEASSLLRDLLLQIDETVESTKGA